MEMQSVLTELVSKRCAQRNEGHQDELTNTNRIQLTGKSLWRFLG